MIFDFFQALVRMMKRKQSIQLSRSLRKIGISMKLNLENNAPEYLLLST